MSEKGKNVISIFDCAGDAATVGQQWKNCLASFKLFADAKGFILDPDKPNIARQRRAQLLHLAGPDVQDVFSTLDDTGTPTEYKKAVDALNSHFAPVANSAYEMRSFRSLTYEKGETVQQFETRLRRAAKDCEFGADADNQIRDEVIAKCNSDYIRRKLLEEGSTLTLANTLTVARQCEEVENQMATLTTSKPETVVTVNRVDKLCKTKQKKVNCVNSEQNPSNVSGDYAFHIKDQASSGVIPTVIGGVKLNMLVDSGATTNIVDEDTWKTLKAKKIQCVSYKQNTELYPYASDKPLTVISEFSCDIKVGKQKTIAKFTVVKGSGVPLLSKTTATKLLTLKV
ncbi:uncharacterized protein [Ptychodera flava]|uniref:uncharacterized protein n=1 Tax=Ptychodera flava TaxID=63121 RepID=UPI003969D151